MVKTENSKLIAAYKLGWKQCADWANRDDLLADIGSSAFNSDMHKDLSKIMKSTVQVKYSMTKATENKRHNNTVCAILRKVK